MNNMPFHDVLTVIHINENRHERIFENPDKFGYRPERGWGWLQRICFSFLRWREAFSEEKEVSITYDTKTIKYDNIRDLILTYRHKFCHHTGDYPTHLICGPDCREEIFICIKDEPWAYQFSITLDRRNRFLGLTLVYSPIYRGPPVLIKV